MYKLCKTEASAARQKAMTQALLHLMMERKYEDITVSDICRELKISRNSFYRYFSDKDAMLYALIDQMLLDFDLSTQIHAVDENLSPDYPIYEMFQFWKDSKPLLDALAFSGLNGVLNERSMQMISKNVPVSSAFQIRDADKQPYANIFAIGGIFMLLIAWHHDGYEKSIDEMTGLMRRLLTQPLFNSNPPQD